MKPTHEQLFDEEFPRGDRHVLDDWRHGVTVTEVYLVGDDYYQARYRVSIDGETNGLRDGNVRILQVFPRQINVTVFEAKI